MTIISPRRVISGDELGRSTGGIVAITGLLSWFNPFTSDAYTPGLPAIVRDLDASVAVTQLTLTSALFGVIAGQVVTGILSDRVGRRPPLLVGLCLFIAASVGCMLAPTMSVLIILRFVQGMAAATAASTARAIGRDLFEGRLLTKFYSINSAFGASAPIVGPILAALVLTATGTWRSIFLMIALLGVVGLLLVILALPETLPKDVRDHNRRAHRAGLSGENSIGPVPIVSEMAITQSGECNALDQLPSGTPSDSRRPRGPLGRVFTDPTTMAAAAVLGTSTGAIITFIGGTSFLLQNDYGLSATGYSVAFACAAALLTVCNLANGRLANRLHPADAATFGLVGMLLAACAVAIAILAQAPTQVLITALVALLGVFGFVFPNLIMMGMAGNQRSAGTAAAVIGIGQMGLGALTTPLIGLDIEGPLPMMTYMMMAYCAVALALIVWLRKLFHRTVRWSRSHP